MKIFLKYGFLGRNLQFPFLIVKILFSFLLVISTLCFGQVPAKRPINIYDLLEVNHIGAGFSSLQVQLSPDGKWIVYQMRETVLNDNKYVFSLWLIDTSGKTKPKQLSYTKESKASVGFLTPRWSPDSRTIAHFVDDEKGKGLALIQVDSFEERRLNLSDLLRAGFDKQIRGTISDYKWSPDARFIAFSAASDLDREKTTPLTKGIEVDVTWNPKRHMPTSPTLLFTAEVSTGEIQPLTDESLNVHSFDWSPEGNQIAFSASEKVGSNTWMNTDIYVVEVPTRNIRLRLKQPGPDNNPLWSSDGKRIAFNSQKGKLDWQQRTTIGVLDPSEGEAFYPADDFWQESGSTHKIVSWSDDNQEIYFQAGFHLTRRLFRVSTNGKRVAQITPDNNRMYSQFSFSRDKKILAFAIESVTEPPNVYVSKASLFKPVKLTHVNPQLDNIARSQIEVIKWRSKDDKWDIHGVLIKPPDYQPGKKYPLLVFLQGGPGMVQMAYNLTNQYPIQVFAAKGYLVLAPNTRGRWGFGMPFYHAIRENKDRTPGPLLDMMTGVDLLVEEGIADPDRLGIMGFSYGGELTAYSITQTNRFKAASIGEGPTDHVNILFHACGDPSRVKFYRDFMGWDPPYDPMELKEIMRQSAIYNVRKVKTPALLEYGSESMAPDHGRIFFQALQYFEVPSQFIVYPRTRHGVSEPLLREDSMLRNLKWFDFWVLGKSK